MKLDYYNKNFKIQRYFRCINIRQYWYLEDEKRWVKYHDLIEQGYQGSYSNMVHCRTVKAFRRKVKKWSKYLPPGTEYYLVNKYLNFDVRIMK